MSVVRMGDSDEAKDPASAGDGRGGARADMLELRLEAGVGGEGRAGEREECRMERALGAAKGGRERWWGASARGT
jgi:hypothetical protein